MTNQDPSTDTNPNRKGRLVKAGVAIAGIVTTALTAVGCTVAHEVRPGDFVCSGQQSVNPEGSIDTLSELVNKHVNTMGTAEGAGDLKTLVAGITLHDGDIMRGDAKRGDTFVIDGHTIYDVTSPDVNAGQKLTLPMYCIKDLPDGQTPSAPTAKG